MIVAPGSTNVVTYWKLVDPTAGTPETGLTIANLACCYVRDGADHSASTALTALATVTTAHTDNYGIEIDATACPGLYRVDFPDAAFAAGVARVQLIVTGAAIDPAVIEVELPVWLTPITGATVRAVNAADAALSTYAGGAVASVTAGVNVTAIGGQAASAAAPVAFPAAVGTSTYAGGLADTNAAAILADTNELQTDWHDGGRLDLLLDAAGSGADPLLNTVPGAYASGTAGYALGRIGYGPIVCTYTGPVLGSGDIDIVQGDAYDSTDGTALEWSFTATTGADWDGETITLYVERDGATVLTQAGTCAQTGTAATATVELTSAQTLALSAGQTYAFQLRGTPGDAARPITPIAGTMGVRARIGS